MTGDSPAFPGGTTGRMGPGNVPLTYPGMTFRDYIAVKVLAAIISGTGGDKGEPEYIEDQVARFAYRMADIMVAQRGLPTAEPEVEEEIATAVEQLNEAVDEGMTPIPILDQEVAQ